MNPLHYPSLELCLRLTEAGFPKTENFWHESLNEIWRNDQYCRDEKYCVCPSVMELLDEMPKEIIEGGMFEFLLTLSPQISPEFVEGNFTVQYLSSVIPLCDINISGTLPNALAEMYLFLKENGYIGK